MVALSLWHALRNSHLLSLEMEIKRRLQKPFRQFVEATEGFFKSDIGADWNSGGCRFGTHALNPLTSGSEHPTPLDILKADYLW